MTGIEKITSRINADAQAEVDAVLSAAQAQADGIMEKYTAQAKKDYQDMIARGKSAAAERESHLNSSAQMEARKMILAAKQEMLDKAFAEAEKQLCGLSDKDMTALLAKLAQQASSTGKEEVILAKGVAKRIGKAVVAEANKGGLNLTLSQQEGSFGGGLLLNDGAVEVNCTFETLVRLARGDMAGQVAKVLFD